MWNVSLPRAQALLEPPVRTLVSHRRQLATVQMALHALTTLPEGDLVETGVFHGGTTILMARAIRDTPSTRTLWSCDSFQGLPRAQREDLGNCTSLPGHAAADDDDESDALSVPRRGCGRGRLGQYRSPRTTVEQALRTERLFKHVRIVPGWFHEALPPAGLQSIGFLRLDGDTYNGTFEALRRLYPLVVPGGIVYVDDAGSFRGAALALRDYFGRPVGTPIQEIEGYFDAIWWVKNASLREERKRARGAMCANTFFRLSLYNRTRTNPPSLVALGAASCAPQRLEKLNLSALGAELGPASNPPRNMLSCHVWPCPFLARVCKSTRWSLTPSMREICRWRSVMPPKSATPQQQKARKKPVMSMPVPSTAIS